METLRAYRASAEESLQAYGERTTNYLSAQTNYFTNMMHSAAGEIDTFSSSLMAQINGVQAKAIEMACIMDKTAHYSMRGMLLGMLAGFFVAGPLGVGSGAWAGTIAGAAWGFREASNQDTTIL